MRLSRDSPPPGTFSVAPSTASRTGGGSGGTLTFGTAGGDGREGAFGGGSGGRGTGTTGPGGARGSGRDRRCDWRSASACTASARQPGRVGTPNISQPSTSSARYQLRVPLRSTAWSPGSAARPPRPPITPLTRYSVSGVIRFDRL